MHSAFATEAATVLLWVFIISNVAIMAAYTFLAVKVVPRLTVSRFSKWAFRLFLLTCGIGTHGEHVAHAILEPHLSGMFTSWHMIAWHVVQAIAAWAFALGFYRDITHLDRIARKIGGTG